MKKTNLRINNFFIVEHNKKFFISDINDLNKWKKCKSLKNFINEKNDKTKILNSLMDEFNIYSNINFIINEKNKSGGKKIEKELSSPIKIIKLDSKQSGGWPPMNSSTEKKQSGGWPPFKSSPQNEKKQSGGWGVSKNN